MFRLEESWAFYLLLLIPVIGLIGYWARQKQIAAVKAFGQPNLVEKLINDKGNHKMKFILFLSSILFLVLALLNPQYGVKKEKVKVEKSDLVIALDISNSMNATDVSPSRLEKSKRFISQLINSRRGDQIGLILFAGSAYLQMPLTSDYAAADLFAKAANTEMAGTQGTAIGEAIGLAMHSVKEENQRALIVISDGEDHDEDAISKAKDAASKGWSIFSIGVGTDEGSFVPVLFQGREEYKMDEEGNPVKSTINKDLLQELADAGNGQFYMLGDKENEIIGDINTQIEKMQKRAVEVKSFTEYRSFFQYFLGIATVLLVLSFFYTPGKKVSV